jgi:hypothetical protein
VGLGLVVGFGLLALSNPVALAANTDSALFAIVVVPGKSMAGVRIGDSLSAVRRVLGNRYRAMPPGLHPPGSQEYVFTFVTVRFRGGRVSAVFSSAPGLRTSEGLALGQPVTRITRLYGSLRKIGCGASVVFVIRGKTASTYFLSHAGVVIAFGFASPTEDPCGFG